MDNTVFQGAATPSTGTSDFNKISFAAQQLINKVVTAKLVEVTAVHPGTGLGPPTVDVLPLVNQVDGLGNATPHGTVYGLAVWRYQSGASAVLMDPTVGDIGLVVVCDRDISHVKASGKQSNPGSRRVYDLADGVYLGGALNGAPTNYIEMTAGNITITTPGTLTINAAAITTTGALTNNGHAVGSTHEHTGVTAGGSLTGPPA